MLNVAEFLRSFANVSNIPTTYLYCAGFYSENKDNGRIRCQR